MYINCIFILLCSSFIYIAKGDEDLRNYRLRMEKGESGECSRKLKVETVEETCKYISPCIKGISGADGPKGETGDKGEKGSQGEIGKCQPRGTQDNPAESCVDSNVPEHDIWLFKPNPFQIYCKDNKEICLTISKKDLNTEEKDNLSTTIPKEPFWLWSTTNKELFKDFYGLEKPQLSHLISISDNVSLELIFHCKNFELKDNIQMLLWDNNLIGQTASSTSPVNYTVPEDLNGCKDLKPNTWGSATILLETWSTAVKNFYVPKNTSDEQKIYIQLNKLCYYF